MALRKVLKKPEKMGKEAVELIPNHAGSSFDHGSW
jgi:hypothetical protein